MKRAHAISKYLRISPRKARLVANLIRGKQVLEAEHLLTYATQKAAIYFKKTLHSAVANAETQQDLRKEGLKVLEVRVDEGFRLKRAVSRARGGRAPILKRTSHFTVVVGTE